MIAFIAALNDEASPVIDIFTEKNKTVLYGKTVYTGKFYGKAAVLAISGIGKVSAALTCQILINAFSPDIIINFGSCGGADGTVTPLNYYCIDKACQYDFDVSDVDDVERGYIQEYDRVFFTAQTKYAGFLRTATLATADRFTNKEEDIAAVKKMGCSVCDMEGAAIAQACAGCNIPLYIVKGISDVHGSGVQYEQFEKNLKAVGDGFPAVLKKIIENAGL